MGWVIGLLVLILLFVVVGFGVLIFVIDNHLTALRTESREIGMEQVVKLAALLHIKQDEKSEERKRQRELSHY